MSLGAQLKQIDVNVQTAEALAIARATGEERARLLDEQAKIVAFFDRLKLDVIEQIRNGVPSKAIRVAVGRDQYREAASLLELYRWQGGGDLFTAKSKGWDQWCVFRDWFKAEELAVYWDYAWDGGGMESWVVLKVRPI